MSIYTKTGDLGMTTTIKQKSIPKSSPIFEVLGTLDEMNSALGIAKSQLCRDARPMIQAVQDDILGFCGELAGGKPYVTDQMVAGMEQSIDLLMESAGESERFQFVSPGETAAGAALDLARGMARRAERELVAKKRVGGVSPLSLRYLNRMSDFLFALARWADAQPQTGFANGGAELQAAGNSQSQGFQMMEAGLWLCQQVGMQAASQGLAVVTAACDSGGHLVAFLRQPNAYIASIDVAQNKAFTSVSLQMPTENLETLTLPGASLYGLQHTNGGRLVIFAGGIPLYYKGSLVGGFGVSGGSAQQDKELAHYAERVYKDKFGG